MVYTAAKPPTFFRLAFERAGRVASTTRILSAKHGLVRPEQILAPYEQSLVGALRGERRRWAEFVYPQLRASAEYRAATTIVWFAGESYRMDLLPMVEADGKRCVVPMEGLAPPGHEGSITYTFAPDVAPLRGLQP